MNFRRDLACFRLSVYRGRREGVGETGNEGELGSSRPAPSRLTRYTESLALERAGRKHKLLSVYPHILCICWDY